MILYFRGIDGKATMVAGTTLENRMVTIKMPNRQNDLVLKMSISKLFLDPECKHTFGFSSYKKTGLAL